MFEKVIQITATGSRVQYSPIGHYCDNCHAEIYVGQDHRKAFRQVICKCRWQLVHEGAMPQTFASGRDSGGLGGRFVGRMSFASDPQSKV
jgi:hypothetical protein